MISKLTADKLRGHISRYVQTEKQLERTSHVERELALAEMEKAKAALYSFIYGITGKHHARKDFGN